MNTKLLRGLLRRAMFGSQLLLALSVVLSSAWGWAEESGSERPVRDHPVAASEMPSDAPAEFEARVRDATEAQLEAWAARVRGAETLEDVFAE